MARKLFGYYNGGVRGVLADALNAIEAAGLGLVALGGGDDLAIAGLEAEAELTGFIGVNLKLGVGDGFIASLHLPCRSFRLTKK